MTEDPDRAARPFRWFEQDSWRLTPAAGFIVMMASAPIVLGGAVLLEWLLGR